MLNHDDVLFWCKHLSDHSSRIKTLFHIEIGAWFIEHVDVYVLDTCQSNDESLKLTTRELSNFALLDAFQFKLFAYIIENSFLIKMLETSSYNCFVHRSLLGN